MQKLLFLLPFYVIRYEKSREDIEKDPEKLQKLLDEYVTISRRLEESLLENGKEALHRYLVEVIIKIADYIFSDSEKTKKGVDRAMGGEVLELKTDKLINEIRQDVKEEVKAEVKEEVKTEIEVKTTEEEEASADKETTQTEETEEAVVASEAKNPPTVSQNEEPNSFAAVNEETKTDEAEEGLPVQTEEQSEELLRDCLGTIRQQINGVTVTLGLRMGDSASTCTLVVCRKGAYEKFFNMQKDDVPFTVRFMDKRYPFSVGVESSMKEVRQRAISVSSVSSLDE